MKNKKINIEDIGVDEFKKRAKWKCPIEGHSKHSGLEHPMCYDKLIKADTHERIGFLDIEACVTPDTLVLTKQGLKYIKDIKKGEFVLTHKNRWRKVIATSKRKFNGTMHEISNTKIPLLNITPNHPLQTIKTEKNRKGIFAREMFSTNTFSNPEWTNGKDLTDFHLLTSIIPDDNEWTDINKINIGESSPFDKHGTSAISSELIMDDDFLTVIGLFLGDGCATNSVVEFFAGEKDQEFIEIIRRWAKKIGASNLSETINGKMNRMRICSSRLATFFRKFYDDKKEKNIPLEWLNLPNNRFNCIIKGLLLSDGSKYKNHSALVNTSDELIKKILIRMNFTKFSVRGYNIKKKKYNKKDKIVGKKPAYALTFYNENCKQIKKWNVLNYSFHKIETLNSVPYKGFVYNLEVEIDHSYIANGFISHNCDLKADYGIMLSWCIKDRNSDKIYSDCLSKDDIKKYASKNRNVNPKDDYRIIMSLIDTMKKFDRIVGHYSSFFDLKFVRTRAVMCGIDYPTYGSYWQTDTIKILWTKFGLSRNGLEGACRNLVGSTRKDHLSLAIKLACIRGESWALKDCLEHNKKDVLDTQDLYEKIHMFYRSAKTSI